MKSTIKINGDKFLTVEPHPNKPGSVLVHLVVCDKPAGFFELDAKKGSEFVCALMDGIAATTVTA